MAHASVEPRYGRYAKKLMQQRLGTRKVREEQMNLDNETFRPGVGHSVIICRNTRKPLCNEPFPYRICGPYRTITLSLMPGT